MSPNKRFTIVFFTILLIDIICSNVDSFHIFRTLSKPGITASLMAFFYIESDHIERKTRNFTLYTLAFLMMGDIAFLEFEDPLFFLIGFGIFGLANFCYFMVFRTKMTFDLDRVIPFMVVTLFYVLTILYFMYEGLGKLFLPVLIYMALVLNMIQAAYLRNKKANKRSFVLVFLGSVLFVLSESMIGLSKFYQPLPYEDVFIMLFYGLGHFFIIQGILAEDPLSKDTNYLKEALERIDNENDLSN